MAGRDAVRHFFGRGNGVIRTGRVVRRRGRIEWKGRVIFLDNPAGKRMIWDMNFCGAKDSVPRRKG